MHQRKVSVLDYYLPNNTMKKIACYDCDVDFFSETSEDVLNQMQKHYMEEHKEIITGNSEEEKKAWMDVFHADWEEAEEI